MNRLAACLLAVLVGCNQGTTTAPSADPNHPENVRKLTVSTGAKNQVHQGGSDKLTVTVTRTNFNDAIEVELRQLPAGVTLAGDDKTIPVGKDTIVLKIVAAADAKPVKGHVVVVAVKPKTEAGMSEITVEFKLDVLDKSDR